MLDVEIAYAWRASWKLGRVLFFLTRYPTFVATGISLYCKHRTLTLTDFSSADPVFLFFLADELGHPGSTYLTLSKTIESEPRPHQRNAGP